MEAGIELSRVDGGGFSGDGGGMSDRIDNLRDAIETIRCKAVHFALRWSWSFSGAKSLDGVVETFDHGPSQPNATPGAAGKRRKSVRHPGTAAPSIRQRWREIGDCGKPRAWSGLTVPPSWVPLRSSSTRMKTLFKFPDHFLDFVVSIVFELLIPLFPLEIG